MVLFLSVLQCVDSNTETGIIQEELLGKWNAVTFEYVNRRDSAQVVSFFDIFQDFSFSLTINADGSYTAVTWVQGKVSQTDRGRLTVSGNHMTLDPENQSAFTLEYSLTENTLFLISTDEKYDFDHDGTGDPAFLRMVFVKV
jgi:hypothetical protein